MSATLFAHPIDNSYDAGNDIQPGVSWSTNPNKNSYPISGDATLIKTTTTTTSVKSTSGQDLSTEAALDKNIVPMDREDPKRQTKALPFAGTDATETQSLIQSESWETRKSHSPDLVEHDDSLSHNGNILDRTMDQIRTWVHSFQHGETQYEEVEVDDHATMDSAKDKLSNAKDTVASKASAAKDSMSATASSVASSANDTMAAASNKLTTIKDSVLHTVTDYTHSVTDTMNSSVKGVSGSVGQLTDTVKTRANDIVHSLSDTANSTINTVKSSVNDYLSQHQSNPNESLTTTVSNTLSQQLPSQAQIQSLSQQYLPSLAQQASSSYAFLGSFLSNYLATYRDFFVMLRQQALPLQMFTVMMFVTHGVLPWFFLDKPAARSVLYCYFIASVLSHGTFFISRSLRYMFLSHLIFVPMLVSLTLHQGITEAGDVSQLIEQFHSGEKVQAMFAAPLSLRSYLFLLWLRVVLMNQATVFTLDLVNISNLLGLSLDTQRGQEGKLIQSRVKVFRKKLAANIHGAAQQLEEADSLPHSHHQHERRSRRNSNAKKQPNSLSVDHSGNVSARTSPQLQSRSLSPQSQPQLQSQSQSQQHQQKWVKKDIGNSGEQPSFQSKELMIESHEKPQQAIGGELRQRHSKQISTVQSSM